MGFFSKLLGNNISTDYYLDLINAYIISNDIKNVQILFGKINKKVSQVIYRDYFNRYGDTEWGIPGKRYVNILSKKKLGSDTEIIWELTHDTFKVSHEVSIPLGENIRQRWVLDKDGILVEIEDARSAYG